MGMSDQKIAVLGAGANGASIGADLTLAGLDVTLIEQWPAHVEAMRTNGLTIEMPDEVVRTPVRVIHVCEVAELTTTFDVVLMLMKAYDSRWASHLIDPYLSDDGLLVGVQNGMTIDTISDAVGADRTLGSVIEISSMMFDPGIVERHSPFDRSWFALGALTPDMAPRIEEVAALLRLSGTVEVVDDIRAAKWMKLVSNACTLVPTAILGLPMIEAAAIPEMRQLMIDSGSEALEALISIGLEPQPIFGMSAESVQGKDLVEQMLDWLLAGFVLPTTKTTVLQDWIKGRHSEVDDIHGTVARTLRQVGHRSPVNDAVVEIAHRIEAHEIETGPQNLELLLAAAKRNGRSD
jgi:2-dehydropantoate 2-reductase